MINNQLLKQLLTAKNPKQILNNMANQSNNPILKRAMELMNNGDSKGVEDFVSKIIQNSGQNPNELFNMFQKMVGKH